jgi:hypothetical protein
LRQIGRGSQDSNRERRDVEAVRSKVVDKCESLKRGKGAGPCYSSALDLCLVVKELAVKDG